MEVYPESLHNCREAGKYAFLSRQETSEAPVLDLSCKKSEAQHHELSNSCDMSPLSMETHSRSPQHQMINNQYYHPQRHQVLTYTNDERISPVESRLMVTPPLSESSSPQKIKLRPIYPKANIPDRSVYMYPPTSLPGSMTGTVSSLPLHLKSSSGGISLDPLQMATSTIEQHQADLSSIPAPSTDVTKKAPRPFKAYPKNPLTLTIGPSELIYDPNSNEAYNEFRKRMLDSVKKTHEGTNIKMRRICKSPTFPTSTIDDKDAAYWERRKKNNEAAKRSRDARRAKEDEIAIRAAFLEQENMRLKYEVVVLRNEAAKLRTIVYSN